ncbi:MAG: hypothetical protein E4H19_16415 [Chromatiales bacterium]|nr:MAG: hypothetical protein E4H19_16415 [Chromatiales bacterium]
MTMKHAALRNGRFVQVAAMVVGFLISAGALAESRAELTEQYVKIFAGSNAPEQMQATGRLEWLGLSDARIFDPAEKYLLDRIGAVEKESANYAAYMAHALAYSGQEKYRDTLTQAANGAANKNLRRHATQALVESGNYARWTPIIADTSNADPALSAEINGFGSMLRSSETDLHRLAAKRIYQGRIRDAEILTVLESRAREAATKPVSTKKDIDVSNWLLKALAATGDPKYRPIIASAATENPNRKVQKNAGKYLKSYYP